MRRTALTLFAGAAALALAACDTAADNEAANAADNEAAAGEGDGTATAAASWPSGARIVEEDGVTFRLDPVGSRVRFRVRAEKDPRVAIGGSTLLLEDGRVRRAYLGLVSTPAPLPPDTAAAQAPVPATPDSAYLIVPGESIGHIKLGATGADAITTASMV